MNANELADTLQETEAYYSTDYKLFDKAAAMLRQQQAEIEELKNAKDYWCLQYKDVFNKLEAQQNDKYKQVLESIANERIELSHDKIKWQCEDHIRWAKDVLK